jgi:hypothetical protein
MLFIFLDMWQCFETALLEMYARISDVESFKNAYI